jgi:hypothetical protein
MKILHAQKWSSEDTYVWQKSAMEKMGIHCSRPAGLQKYTLSTQSPATKCAIASAITYKKEKWYAQTVKNYSQSLFNVASNNAVSLDIDWL